MSRFGKSRLRIFKWPSVYKVKITNGNDITEDFDIREIQSLNERLAHFFEVNTGMRKNTNAHYYETPIQKSYLPGQSSQ